MAAQAQWQLSGDYFENCNCNVVCLARANGKLVPAVRVPPAVPDFAERSDVVMAYRIALTNNLSHRHVYVARVTGFDPHVH
jgi:hypothetical protein